jgi:hypothetical protein
MAHAFSFIPSGRLRREASLLLWLALGAAAPALAAPPPGHPTPAQTQDMLMPDPATSRELSNEGLVVSTLDANEFTYIEVSRAGAVEWLAAPLMAIKPGSTIRFEDGSVMANFYSKLLQRTFSSIRFVGAVRVTATP